jgi:hypothetical protein
MRFASASQRGGLLVKGLFAAGGPPPGRLRRAIFQLDGAKPIEIPPAQIEQRERAALGPATSAAETVVVGVERVRVPAGVFRARHLRVSASAGLVVDVWIAEVVALGAIQLRTPEQTMVLAAHGRDAASEVTGEPLLFDPGKLRFPGAPQQPSAAPSAALPAPALGRSPSPAAAAGALLPSGKDK